MSDESICSAMAHDNLFDDNRKSWIDHLAIFALWDDVQWCVYGSPSERLCISGIMTVVSYLNLFLEVRFRKNTRLVILQEVTWTLQHDTTTSYTLTLHAYHSLLLGQGSVVVLKWIVRLHGFTNVSGNGFMYDWIVNMALKSRGRKVLRKNNMNQAELQWYEESCGLIQR